MKEIILDKLRDNTSLTIMELNDLLGLTTIDAVSYTHLRAHET